jgi:hypothetical protein
MRTCSCIILEDGGGDGVAGTNLKGTTGNNQCKLYKFGIETKMEVGYVPSCFRCSSTVANDGGDDEVAGTNV